MELGDKYAGDSITNNDDNCQFDNGLVVKQKRQRKVGLSSWLVKFAFVDIFRSLLSAMVFFNFEPNLFRNLVQRLVEA